MRRILKCGWCGIKTNREELKDGVCADCFERKNYKRICLAVWGCVPVDKEWAKNTELFKEALKNLTMNGSVASKA